MRISSTDASSVTQFKELESNANKLPTKDSDNGVPINNAHIDNRSLSQLTPSEKKDLPISDKVVIDAIEKANKAIMGSNRRFEFSIHEKTKQIMVKVINADTNEVIREIPPEKTLDMVAKMWEMAGIIVDERR